jgi:hypothetical protein
MSHQFNSEKDLFEEEQQDEETARQNRLRELLLSKSKRTLSGGSSSSSSSERKRHSFGLRLPVAMADGSGSSGEGKGNGLGTTLGVPSMRKASGGHALDYERTSSDGKWVPLDLWNTAMTDISASGLSRILEQAKMDVTYSLEAFIRGIEYQGFDREFYIKHALTKMTVSVFCRFAVIGAVRGSNFTRICETCENMPDDLKLAFNALGFVKTPRKRTDLTILRNTASIPHWCAYFMMQANVSKKIADDECPAYLQFPGAASVPMSRKLREAHIKFCVRFSSLLPGGRFNPNIYLTAYNNMIPLAEIPQELISVLGVSSISEAKALTSEEITDMTTKTLTRRV